MAKMYDRNDSANVERSLGTSQRIFDLGRSGGTSRDWKTVAKVASGLHKEFRATPGREREAATARRNAMRAQALSNMARKSGGKIGATSHSAHLSPGALKAVPMGKSRGGSGGGSL